MVQNRHWASRFLARHVPSTVNVENTRQLRSMRPVIIYSVDGPRDTLEERAHVRALRTLDLAIRTAAPDPRRGVRTPGVIEQAHLSSRNLV